MSGWPRYAGRLFACELYGVNPKLALDLAGTEYGPRYLERRPDDRQRVTDQVSMLFDKLPTYDADSNFPMPGTTNQMAG